MTDLILLVLALGLIVNAISLWLHIRRAHRNHDIIGYITNSSIDPKGLSIGAKLHEVSLVEKPPHPDWQVHELEPRHD